MNLQINNTNGFNNPKFVDIDSGLEIKDVVSYNMKHKVIDHKYITEITLTICCDNVYIKHAYESQVTDNKIIVEVIDKKESEFSNLILD